jgi:hypothetical protein
MSDFEVITLHIYQSPLNLNFNHLLKLNHIINQINYLIPKEV